MDDFNDDLDLVLEEVNELYGVELSFSELEEFLDWMRDYMYE